MKKPSISIILSTYENPRALGKVLLALSRQLVPADEIHIADDGSGKATETVIEDGIRKLGLPVTHHWQEHGGFRKSIILNRAIAASRSDYLILLDGDCVPEREFVADHASLAERGFWVQGRRAFVNESAVENFTPTRRCVWGLFLKGGITGLPKALRVPFPIVRNDQKQRGILGCNLGVWRNDIVAVNGFDESFVGWGREDADLANRLYHLGLTRKFVYGRAILFHLNHPTAPRNRVAENQSLLERSMAEKRIRAHKGLDQHL